MKSRRPKKLPSTCHRQPHSAKISPFPSPLRTPRQVTPPLRAPEKPASSPAQKTETFPSLDFPGRETLSPRELSRCIGCSIDHIYDLILEGQLRAIDISGRNNNSARRSLRVPVESWRKFLNERMT